ncbi:ATP-binding protein [Microaceticoccus formicicus]|uniref:ATP-binding protein n=1 Tax=Microaceticoccus formicicus TaxID=3118105 RepID=UPI003CD0142C|nr:ATP-binding protein [Peptoniphilaceae bacterium AMB_02]
MAYYYSGKLMSDLNHIDLVVKSIIKKVDRVIADENLLFDIRLIINELVINGCEHGNCFDNTKYIDLKLAINERVISIQVIDEGEGLNYDFSTYDPCSLMTSGRGLKIVKELSDELIIKENSITAIINK